MSNGRKIAVALALLAGLVATTLAWVYLSGFVYLLLSKTNPTKATLLTLWQYVHYYGHIPAVKDRLVVSSILAALVAYLGPLLLLGMALRGRRELHGSARFATAPEIRKTGLLDASRGVLVGKFGGKYLTFGGQQFVILAAPTRSGKGVGVVVPNLLNFNDSVVVLDVKQENYDLTAGFRARHGQDVFLFNPFAEDMRTHRYNPLGYISDNPHFRVGDILAIGHAFWSGQGKDPFWDDQSRNLFLGLCLYLLETPALPRTMGELLRQSSGQGQPVKDYLQGLIEARNFTEEERVEGGQRLRVRVPRSLDDDGLPPLSGECVDALNRFCNASDNTLAGILASFNAPLVIWSNPIVDAATSANDFDLRDVRRKRMTVYVGITPDHLAEAAVLVNVLFSQLVNLNTKELPQKNPALKYQCLLLMDEFTAIGKVAIIAKAVSYMAGYNLRLLPIIQSVSQLASVYGQEDARTFVTNHALQILFAPREQKDANEYSEMLGYRTVHARNKSRSHGKGNGNSVSETTGEGAGQKRALLLPQEFRELGQWKQVIVLENSKPILCDKIRYFDDPVFTQRLLPAPAVPLLDLDRHREQLRARPSAPAVRTPMARDDASGLDLANLPTLEGDRVDEAAVNGFVNDFFAALGGGAEAAIGHADDAVPPRRDAHDDANA